MKSETAMGIAAVAGLGLLLLIAFPGEASAAPSEGDKEPPAPPEDIGQADRAERIRLSREGKSNEGLSIGESTVDQTQVVDAVWQNYVEHNPLPLAAVVKDVPRMSLAMQTYVLAAARRGKNLLRELDDWKRNFDRVQASLKPRLSEQRKAALAETGAILGAAAAAVNAIPTVGQALSAVLALGLALYESWYANEPLPVRSSGEQTAVQLREGSIDGFNGLSAGDDASWPRRTSEAVRQKIQEDWVGSQLPLLRRGTLFRFMPTLEQFRAVGQELKLYPSPQQNQAAAQQMKPYPGEK